MIKKNSQVELKIIDMTVGGDGVGKIDGFTVFVMDALVGDLLLVGITKVKKNYAYARIIDFIEKSPDRIATYPKEHEKCGGCRLQHLSYEAQLRWKEAMVKNHLSRIGGFKDISISSILGMEKPTHYRNKAQYPLAKLKDKTIVYGFYAPHSHRVIANQSCLIQSPAIDSIMAKIVKFLNDIDASIYEANNKFGELRHIVIREGYFTKELMVALVINSNALTYQDKLIELLRDEQNLVSLQININKEDTNVILGKKSITIYGRDYIYDYIGNLKFKISLNSFFQVNPLQTKILYDTAISALNLDKETVVYDLYCGIGSIGLYLAKNVKKVIGIEIVEAAIKNAKENLVLNKITNMKFYLGDAKTIFKELSKSQDKADIIIVDPPRKGCDKQLLEDIILMSPRQILYISCDSATLSRDLRILCQEKYKIKSITPVDMFPMTTAIETCAVLEACCIR